MRPQTLLATDMDGTVIPLNRRRERKREIAAFKDAVRRSPSVCLAYVTGRHLELALEGIARFELPTPRIMVCDVGTSLYRRKGKRWVIDNGYRRKMRACLGNHTGDDIAVALEGTAGLTPQEDEKQAEFKRSYYLPLRADRKKAIARVKGRLRRRGIRANLIFSVDPVKRRGLLDVLPALVAKDFALHYLQRSLRLQASRVVYAGDSGNDLLAFASGFPAIVVANTPERVKRVLRSMIRKKRTLADTVFFAKYRFAKGVLEGARHFGVFPA